MTKTKDLETSPHPLEYLVVGHVTTDLTETGTQLGGTVTFSGLTAAALGIRTGIITSHQPDLDISPLQHLWVKTIPSKTTTTFKNISDGVHRRQYLYEKAAPINPEDIPEINPPPAIVHLGPVADEVNPVILSNFPQSMKCLTPQGWLRTTNSDNQVHSQDWANREEILAQVDAAVVSLEDVQYDEEMIAGMASAAPVFAVTENYKGARIYWHNDARFFSAPKVKYEDDTGAGDIFSAAFFCRYFQTKDPWEAGRFAVLIASWSVAHKGLDSIPSEKAIEQAKTEVLGQ